MREKPQRRCLHDFIGKKAFAIISRSAKKPRKLYFGITSSQIICDRWLVQSPLFSLGIAMHTHRCGALQVRRRYQCEAASC